MRQTVALAAPTLAPLAALKDWLAITGSGEDALLADCLAAALALCESFTGRFPLAAIVTERLPASGGIAVSRPVRRVESVVAIAADGVPRPLAPGDYAASIDCDGGLTVRPAAAITEAILEIRLEAGLAADWATLDAGLRHGILRHAAHQYRERDAASTSELPAAVAALWRPWRRVGL